MYTIAPTDPERVKSGMEKVSGIRVTLQEDNPLISLATIGVGKHGTGRLLIDGISPTEALRLAAVLISTANIAE